MRIHRKNTKNFVFFLVFLKFVLFSSNLFSATWGGILPYCYIREGKSIEAYLLVAHDSESSGSVWGDFGEKISKTNVNYWYLMDKISEFAHVGTRGIFAGVHNNLITQNCNGGLKKNLDNFCAGKSFFINRMCADKSVIFRHGENIDYHLYFVKVHYVMASTLLTSFYNFRKTYESRGFDEYLRYDGYVWINAKELLDIIEDKNRFYDPEQDEIYLSVAVCNLIKKSSRLKKEFAGKTVILNSYLSEELRSPQGVRILKEIIEGAKK